ncbi:hypothetical protein J3P77_09475 [Pseudomonas sp. R1-18]|uniref:hypothetical protein n=1 Tax=Pseudomonas sp. R1-18 TaxID=1632772 RepID=UPI003DA95795
MSVQSNTYLLVGVMLPYDHFDDVHDDPYEVLEPYTDSAYKGIEHHNGLCVLYDGMGGSHIAIGRVLAKSDDQNGNYGFNAPIDATTAMTPELQAEVAKLVQQQFNFAPDVRAWILTHYR